MPKAIGKPGGAGACPERKRRMPARLAGTRTNTDERGSFFLSAFISGHPRPILATIFILSLWLVSPCLRVSASSAASPPPRAYVPGVIVVKFKPGLSRASMAEVHARHQAVVEEEIPQLGVQIVSVPPDESGAQLIAPLLAAYSADPRVEFAEPDYLAQPAYEPNDPYCGDGHQWGPQKIQAPLAWNLSTGDPSVIIAVVDWGVDLHHPDLETKIWTNPGEIPGNGIDDDGNGYADDVYGWDFANDDNDPQNDDYGHGSHVAGIAAAATDNGVGIAGVAFNSRIMAVKVGYVDPVSGPLARYSDIADGIMYAARDGAKVINLSLGGYGYSRFLESAVNYAWNAGCVLVGAVGNNSLSDPFYPAAYDNVIGVSATDQNDNRASWSNYGLYVSVAAPGVSIYSTYWNGSSTYAYMSGTSMAAPHVAGLAALLFAQDGTRSNTRLRSLIEDSADDLGSAGWDQYYGHGRVNAYQALGTSSSVLEPETGGSLSAVCTGRSETCPFSLDFPPGAVTSTTTVTHTLMAVPHNPIGSLAFANVSYRLEATDAAGNPVTRFSLPYSLTLRYQDSDWQNAGISDENHLNLYYWDGSQWQAVLPCPGCSLDTINNVLVAVLDHFTEFGLMGQESNPTRVVVSSFVARSGEAVLIPDQSRGLSGVGAGLRPARTDLPVQTCPYQPWLVLLGLTAIAFGSRRARPGSRSTPREQDADERGQTRI